jgi:hypothetical protein
MALSLRYPLLVSNFTKYILVMLLRLRAGTAVLLKPGIILGGSLSHECPLSRAVGYFLEPLIMLAPFAKRPLDLTLRGITTDDKDLSVGHICFLCHGWDLSDFTGRPD